MIFRIVTLAGCFVFAVLSAARADFSAQVGGGGTGPAGRWIPEKSDEHHDSLNQAASASVSAENGNGSYTSQVTTTRGAGNVILLQAEVHTKASAALPTSEPAPDTGVPAIVAYGFATYTEKLRIQVPPGFTRASDTLIYFFPNFHSNVQGAVVARVSSTSKAMVN